MEANQEKGSAEPNVLLRRRLRLLAVICVLFMVTPTLLSFINFQRTFVILSDSMNPTLRSGDLILINPVDGEIPDETIIIFKSPLGGFQAHRVIDQVNKEGRVYYITKGDANEKADSYIVPEKNIIGVLSFIIPRLGMYFLIPREITMITTLTLIVAYVILTFNFSQSFTFSFKRLYRFFHKQTQLPFFLHRKDKDLLHGREKKIKIRGNKNAYLLIGLILFSSFLARTRVAESSINLGYPNSIETIAVTSPPITLQAGTAGESTIYDNGTNALVNVTLIGTPFNLKDYVDNTSNEDFSADKGTHSNFTAQQYGPDSVYDTLTEDDVSNDGWVTLFSDSFDRSDNATVGNGWIETEQGSGNTKISGNRLVFDTVDDLNVPIVTHTFSPQTSGFLNWTFVFNFDRTGAEGTYELWMQLGNNATFVNPTTSDNSGVAVNLKWAGTTRGMTNHEGFGYVQGASVTEVAVVSDTDAAIEVIADLNNNVFNLTIDGTLEASNVAFDNNVTIDAVRLYTDELYQANFDLREFDDLTIARALVNYDLDLEVQWTNLDYDETNEELAIYVYKGNNTHSLDAIDGYMIVGDGTPDWGSTKGTISFWIKMDGSVQGRFWGQNGNMETRWSGTNLVLDWGATASMTSAYSFSADKWYFIAIVWDETNDNLFLYVGDENNAPILDANSLIGTWTSTTPAPTENRFMNGIGGNEPVDGHGDDLRYWNIARNLTAIQSDYIRTLTGSEPNLQSYFKLDNNFDDIGPNDDDGSGSGSYSFSSDVPFDAPPTENIRVDVWDGVEWQILFSDLANGWNNISVSSYLTSSSFTIRFKGSSETNDTTQDAWNIDATLIHVWTSVSGDFNYLLNISENSDSNWKVRLDAFDQSNINRLTNCSIYIYNGSNSTQIIILNGVYNQQTGSWYDLAALNSNYIWMHIESSIVGTSYIYVYLEILTPESGLHLFYKITFEIT